MSTLPSRSRRKYRKLLIAIYGDRCYYCGCGFAGEGKRQRTIDHLFPLSRGGANELSNLVLACSRCNHLKGPMTWLEFVCTARYRQRLRSAVDERSRPPKQRTEVLTRLDAPTLTAA